MERGEIQPDAQRLMPLQKLEPPRTAKSLQRVLGLFVYYAKWISQFSEKAYLFIHSSSFPLNAEALSTFELLKSELRNATLYCIDESLSFVVECYASDVAISGTLDHVWSSCCF